MSDLIIGVLAGGFIFSPVAAYLCNIRSRKVVNRLQNALDGRDRLHLSVSASLHDRINALYDELQKKNAALAHSNGVARSLAIKVRELGGES